MYFTCILPTPLSVGVLQKRCCWGRRCRLLLPRHSAGSLKLWRTPKKQRHQWQRPQNGTILYNTYIAAAASVSNLAHRAPSSFYSSSIWRMRQQSDSTRPPHTHIASLEILSLESRENVHTAVRPSSSCYSYEFSVYTTVCMEKNLVLSHSFLNTTARSFWVLWTNL